MKEEETANNLAHKIDLAPLKANPFGHIFHENIFPTSLYGEMLENLPDSRFYRELRHPDALQSDGRSARLMFSLYPENIRRLPDGQRKFWSDLTQEMTSMEVERAFKNKFKKILQERCHKRVEYIKLRSWPMLFRDIAGYKISIHPDTPEKAITTQYYLPADESQVHLGTVLHERLTEGGFTEVAALPFRPNTGYAFAVTKESWHSVKVMNGGGQPRNSLMVIYFYDQGLIRESVKLVKRKCSAVGEIFSRRGGKTTQGY
jgi:hypothetical protein